MEKYKYKMQEKYIQRRAIATMLGMQLITIIYVLIFIYGIVH